MDTSTFEKLHASGQIDEETLHRVKNFAATANTPVMWDLLTLLYIGIFLLTTGLGITIYKNIDSIGHTVIVTAIATAMLGCLYYCLAKANAFSFGKVEAPNVWFDYVLLSGCLLMLILVGYLQFQFQVFGNRWGMATFIPMLLLFAAAYYFDHLGVLSLAITNLAAWVGITITPTKLLLQGAYNGTNIIYSGILLGIALVIAGMLSANTRTKAHFSFTYKNFGTHLLFVSLLAAIFTFSNYGLWLLPLAAMGVLYYLQAVKEQSLYFLVVSAIYVYVGLAYVFIRFFDALLVRGDGIIYLSLFYLIISSVALAFFLIHYNKTFKKHAGL